MEIVVAFLIAAVFALWMRADRLSDRVSRLQDELAGLGDRLVPGPAADLAPGASAAAPSAAVPMAPEVAPPMVEAPVPSYWVAPRSTKRRAAEPVGTAPQRVAAASAAAPPSAVAQLPPPRLPQAEPAGPGLGQQLLVRLGLTAPAAGEGFSRAAIETWLEGRMLAVVGGIALLLGAIFFLSLAFSRGWITEPMRVLIGLAVGAALLVLGEVAFSKLRGILGPVLVAVGLAIVSLALLAATRLYGLVPVEWGLVGAFVAAVAAAAIAVRHDSELVAAFGLVAVLAAPPVLGASPTMVTLLFVAVTLVGTTAVALFRTWVWLPPLAFILAAPQLASYVSGDAPVAESLVAVAGFWLVNAVAAGGEETRHATERLRASTVTLLLADAAFTIWAGFTVLSGPDETWRGSFLAVLAVAHLALGLFFLLRNGDRHAFGLVVAATGVATLTMAVPVQFGGPPVAIAWAAEAVALAWVAVVRRHPYSAGVGILLGALAIGHLVGIEYRPSAFGVGFDRAWPFVGPEGMTYGFMLAALAVAALLVPIGWVQAGLAVTAGLITAYVLPFELSGPALVAGWSLLAVLAVAFMTRVVAPRLAAGFVEERTSALALPAIAQEIVDPVVRIASRLVRPSIIGVAVLGGVAALAHLVAFDFPIDRLGDAILSTVPYVGAEGLSLAAVLVGLIVLSLLVRDRALWLGAAGVGLALLVYSVTYEIGRPEVMAAWAIGALASVALVRRVALVSIVPRSSAWRIGDVAERVPFAAGALALLFLVVQAFSYAGPVAFGRHLTGTLGPEATPFVDIRTFALVILAVTAGGIGWLWSGTLARSVAGVAAALVVAWLLPFEIRTGYAVAGWSALLLLGAWVVRTFPATRELVGLPGAALGGLAVVVALLVVAPPTRLVVDPFTTVLGWPLLTDATVALGALAIAFAVGARLLHAEPLSRWAMVGAGVTLVYLLSVGLVDLFQQQVGTRVLEDLQKEAQVGLSVLWSVLGVVGFAVGLWVHRSLVRLSGLALLGLATVKVFLVDLAALDVAYRVLSLVALGILLLVSAMLYSRMQHPHPPTTPKPA
jgi:predicted membrane protein DUF2339